MGFVLDAGGAGVFGLVDMIPGMGCALEDCIEYRLTVWTSRYGGQQHQIR